MSKIIIRGNPVDGFEYLGPYTDAAIEQAADKLDGDGDWWVAPLNTIDSVEPEKPEPVEPKLPFPIVTAVEKRALGNAVDLLSEDGENPEYDRALAEMVTRFIGKGDGHIPQIVKYLREAANYNKALAEQMLTTCRNCDKPTPNKYCSMYCEAMDKHPAPRDDMEKFTS